jgi:hypothetical protein
VLPSVETVSVVEIHKDTDPVPERPVNPYEVDRALRHEYVVHRSLDRDKAFLTQAPARPEPVRMAETHMRQRPR